MLVLDRSGSIGESQSLDDVRRTAVEFINQMNLQIDQAGLVTFNNQATLDQPLTRDRPALEAEIASIEAQGGTNIADGLNRAVDELQRIQPTSQALPVIVLLTDGQTNGGDEATLAAAQAAHQRGIRVITIGLGAVNSAILEQVASSPEDYHYAPTSGDLSTIYASIADDLNCGVQGSANRDLGAAVTSAEAQGRSDTENGHAGDELQCKQLVPSVISVVEQSTHVQTIDLAAWRITSLEQMAFGLGNTSYTPTADGLTCRAPGS